MAGRRRREVSPSSLCLHHYTLRDMSLLQSAAMMRACVAFRQSDIQRDVAPDMRVLRVYCSLLVDYITQRPRCRQDIAQHRHASEPYDRTQVRPGGGVEGSAAAAVVGETNTSGRQVG